jgi:hypothetical protein
VVVLGPGGAAVLTWHGLLLLLPIIMQVEALNGKVAALEKQEAAHKKAKVCLEKAGGLPAVLTHTVFYRAVAVDAVSGGGGLGCCLLLAAVATLL